MAVANNTDFGQAWKGGDKPFAASYGKLMMWFFLVTDALTFSGFLAAYGFSRFKYEYLGQYLMKCLHISPFSKENIHCSLLL